VYCGMRAFTRRFYDSLDQRCTGMEFATEMIIKASLRRARIAEVPITLYPDGRQAHPPHLKTFRDGWRTLRFFLLYSPRWLFQVPGAALLALGLLGYALALPGTVIGTAHLDVHTLLFASLAVICGYQAILFALCTRVFAVSEGMLPADPQLTRFFAHVKLEHGLLAGLGAVLVGGGLLAWAVQQWMSVHFGDLTYPHTLRWVVPGVTLTALGVQTILSSFFVSLLGMRRR
jgi:hypothetical protein